MAEFEHEQTVPVDARVVFDLARDVTAMQAWLPDGLQVESSGPERVTGRVSMGDEIDEAEGYLAEDAEQRRLEWGDLEGGGYSGWLQVDDEGPGRSRVVLHLDVTGEHHAAVGGEAHEITDEYLVQALSRLAALAAQSVT
ncbi:SRPBCC family protein [Saccharothrix sp. 6-C]|uniref:Polyketide cyclase/dehydrase/lipid transport protein n=1 Tax=Saccharothrix texasensis TaxID=103734 RepID=A0A3N1HGI7_9PSEU|nr:MULTISPECIES: SRPBCC family protein [Saccharothrix]QQQ74525.1 SRPBCC family protein [Saccharothrix sp. 6-C]ROP41412.1 polyketide cyclase/dehydrase/lipid transport protein [Saccharothrix texasensis]